MREGKGGGDACCFVLVLECSAGEVYTEVKGGNEIVVNKENKENKENSDRGA